MAKRKPSPSIEKGIPIPPDDDLEEAGTCGPGVVRNAKGHLLPGSKLWKQKDPTKRGWGVPPKFANADELWEVCVKYFEWADANPIYEQKVFNYKGVTSRVNVPKLRAYTHTGLCAFIDVYPASWKRWAKEREDLLPVIEAVDAIIYEQKFTGAAAEVLNSSFIARDLGLADRSELSGLNGGPIETEVSAKDVLLDRLNAILEARSTG